MEKHEKDYVEANKSELIGLTNCNSSLLVKFQSGGHLDKEEIEEIEGKVGEIAKARKFYDTIIKKHGVYPFLVQALTDTCQTGAVVLLEKLPTPSTSFTTSNPDTATGNRAMDRVVGKGDCDFVKVVDCLTSEDGWESLIPKLIPLARRLKVPGDSIVSLEKQLNQSTLQASEALHKILQSWVAKHSSKATLGVLTSALDGLDLGDLSEALERI